MPLEAGPLKILDQLAFDDQWLSDGIAEAAKAAVLVKVD
jgi:hypothetical protein